MSHLMCNFDGCSHYKEGNTEFCATHNHARRKAERIALKPKKKPKAIPKTSAKRDAKLVLYRPLKKEYLEQHPECEIKLIGCEGKAVEIHHCSTSDLDFLNVLTWKGGCRHCHDTVERVLSAEIRREKGLLISSPSLNRDIEKNVI